MAQIIGASIDLTKIDKNRIKPGKNGQKYYDISIIVNDEADQFGNTVAITESQTKEEREAKEKKKYIGNGKVVWDGGSNAGPGRPIPAATPAESDEPLPF